MVTIDDLPLIADALSAVRASIDNYLSTARLRERAEDQYLQFEAVRIRFVSRMEALRISRRNDRDRANDAVVVLAEGISSLLNDEKFQRLAERARIGRTLRPGYRAPPTEFSQTLEAYLARQAPDQRGYVLDLLVVIHRSLEGGIKYYDELPLPSVSPSQRKRAVDQLKRIVPDQKIAPIQFDIVDGKLSVAKQTSEVNSETRLPADSAQADLVARGSLIIQELVRSNCDRRLLEQFSDLQERLNSRDNIIQLGLANIASGLVAKSYDDELPAAVSAMIQAQNIGISMYVAQFPDWVKFSENASSANINNSDAINVGHVLSDLIDDLRKNPEISTPQVPDSLIYLREIFTSPSGSAKRITFAVIRTMENFVSRIFRFGADLLDKTISKTAERLSTSMSRVIVAAFWSCVVCGNTANPACRED